MIRVEVDGVGPVEFPDGTSQNTMHAVLMNRFGPKPEDFNARSLAPVFAMNEPGGTPPQPKPEPKQEWLTASEPGLLERIRGSWAMRKLAGPTALEREGMIEPGVSPMDLVSTAFKFASPPPQIANALRQTTDPLIQRTGLPEDVQGMVTGAREFALNFPWGAAGVNLGKSFGRAILGVFTGEYAFSLPEVKAQFDAALRQGDHETAGRIATESLLNGALLATGAIHMTGRGEPLTRQQEAIVDAVEYSLKRPVGLPRIDEAAREALNQRAGEVQQPFVPEAPASAIPTPEPMGTFRQVTAPMPKRAQEPTVPETPPEIERGLTVLQEIRQKGLRTKEQIREVFPQINREQAAELRRLAWPEDPINKPQPTQPKVEPAITQGISEALAAGDLKTVKKLAQSIPNEFTGVSESLFNLERIDELAPKTAEALKTVIKEQKGVEDAGKIPIAEGLLSNEVREGVVKTPPLRQQGETPEAQAEAPPVEAKAPAPPVIPESRITETAKPAEAVQTIETIDQKLDRLQKIESEQDLNPKKSFVVHWVESGEAKTRLFSEGSTAQEFAVSLRSKGIGGIQIKTLETATPPKPAEAAPEAKAAETAIQTQVEKPQPPVAQQTKPPTTDKLTPKQQKKYLFDEAQKALSDAPQDQVRTEHPSKSAAEADFSELRTVEETKPDIKKMFPDETYHKTEQWDQLRDAQKQWWKDVEGKLKPLFDRWGIKKKTSPGYKTLDPEKPSPPQETSTETMVYELREKLKETVAGIPDTITIDVPGDGTFTILNNKGAIAAFMEKAKKFPTTVPRARGPSQARTEPAKPPIVQTKRTLETDLDAMESHLSTDPQRNVITHYLSDGSHFIATDGRRMIVVDRKGPGTPKKPVAVDENGKVIDTGSKTIPDWRQVDPVKTELWFKGLDTSRLFNLVKQALGALTDKTRSITIYRDSEGRLGIVAKDINSAEYATGITESSKPLVNLNGDFVLDIVEASRRLGSEKIDMRGTDELGPVVFEGKGFKAILMPMRGDGFGDVPVPPKSISAPVTPPPTGPGEAGKGIDPKMAGPGGTISSDVGVSVTDLTQLAQSVPKNAPTKPSKVQVGKSASTLLNGVNIIKAALQKMRTFYESVPQWKNWEEALGDWMAKREQSTYDAYMAWKKFKSDMPDTQLRDAIAVYVDSGGDRALIQQAANDLPGKYGAAYRRALNLTPDEITFSNNIRNYFDSRLKFAEENGLELHALENYIHRIYEPDSPWKTSLLSELQYLLTGKPGFAKQRFYQFDADAIRAGKKPVLDFAARVLEYDQALLHAIADRGLVKSLMKIKEADGRPLLDVGGNGDTLPPTEKHPAEAVLIKPQYKPWDTENPKNHRGDYLPFNHPAFRKAKWVSKDTAGNDIFVQGDVLVHPAGIKKMRRLLEKSSIRQHEIGRVALQVSSTMKQTMLDLSLFHPVQITVHGLEHTVNPLRLKPINFADTTQYALVKHGLVVAGDRGYYDWTEGLTGSSLVRRVPWGVGDRIQGFHDVVFKEWIPTIKMNMALEALERNQKRYPKLTEDQVLRLTAQQANAAFGGLNYRLMGRSQTMQDALRLLFLAPDFLEARGRFAGQALKGHGKEQLRALMLGAAVMYVTSRVFNRLYNGNPHYEKENAFKIVIGDHAYSLRTVQGDILHLIEKPGKFWYHRLNPTLVRPVIEAVTRRDYFGREVGAVDIAKGMVPVPISLRGIFEGNEQTFFESAINAMGFVQSRYNSVTQAYELARTWKKENKVKESPGEFIYDPSKDPLRDLKYYLQHEDSGRAAQSIDALFQAKQYTRAKLVEYFNNYSLSAFTGSTRTETKFLSSLRPDQREVIKDAKSKKGEIRKEFIKALRLYDLKQRGGD